MAKITKRDKDSITIELTIKLEGDMFAMEKQISSSLNGAGIIATKEALQKFDADGSPIKIGPVKYTSKGKSCEKYETPYGPVDVDRHTYQNSDGGVTYVPLEHGARLILNSTPLFARQVSFMYASFGANMVARAFMESNGRSVSNSYIKNLVDTIGAIAEAKEDGWKYELPEHDEDVASAAISLDGTCMLMKEDGWRVAMVGSISLYTKEGERLFSLYTGSSPEYGKEKFMAKLEREIKRIKELYPNIHYSGVADGAKENWDFLKPHVDSETLDFYHASEYVSDFGKILHKENECKRESWLRESLHNLKHMSGAAENLLKEFVAFRSSVKDKKTKEEADRIITYFKNHKHQMMYSKNLENNLPIGSGVIEAACKTLIKSRMCYSGMAWKDKGATAVITLRALVLTSNRWDQFWQKYTTYGYHAA